MPTSPDPSIPPLWNPLGFLRECWEDKGLLHEGPIAMACLFLTVVATACFLALCFRKRPVAYFSVRLFLALMPFGLLTIVAFLRFYAVLGMMRSPDATFDQGVVYLLPVAYPVQFGLILTDTLVVLHTVLYFLRDRPARRE
jgi:hypothetical protein